MHFLWKKKPLREAPQRIWGFYPEKKAPAGGRTTDMGFLYIKSKIPKSKNPQKIQNFKIKNPTSKNKNPTSNANNPTS